MGKDHYEVTIVIQIVGIHFLLRHCFLEQRRLLFQHVTPPWTMKIFPADLKSRISSRSPPAFSTGEKNIYIYILSQFLKNILFPFIKSCKCIKPILANCWFRALFSTLIFAPELNHVSTVKNGIALWLCKLFDSLMA